MKRPRPDRRPLAKLRTLLAWALAGMLGLVPVGALAAQACVQPGSGIGGTGAPQGGIGGTGAAAAGGTGGTGDRAGSGIGGGAAVAGGIGGTGDTADSGVGGTGIVGTITGFASVCIGELEVHFDAATPVSINGQPGKLDQLALGQVVAMEAGRGAKGLTARSIAILNALEGPVTHADAARGVFEVMGQPVRLAAGIDVKRIAAGAAVRVSGLRDLRGVVHATRVEPAVGLRQSSAIGVLRSGRGGPNVDGLRVVGVGDATSGTELLVRGQWDGRRLQVLERRADPSVPFAGRVRAVVVEGLVHERSAQTLRISGFEVRLGSAVRPGGDVNVGMAEGNRVRVTGRLESGRRIVAERLEADRGRGNSGADDRMGGRSTLKGADDAANDGRAGAGRSSDSSRNDDGGKRGGGSGERGENVGDRGGSSGDRGSSSGGRSGSSDDRGSRPETERNIRVEKVDKVDKACLLYTSRCV